MAHSRLNSYTKDFNKVGGSRTSSAWSNGTSFSSSSSVEPYSEDEHEEEFDNVPMISVYEEPNAVKMVLKDEAYSFDVAKFSEKLIEATYVEAQKQLNQKKKLITVYDLISPIIEDLFNSIFHDNNLESKTELPSQSESNPSFHSHNNVTPRFQDWPKNSEFNIKLGLEKIEEYVSTWERLQNWMFCVEFLGFESEDCSNVFVYEVEWSKPTNAYPIPQATASIYFALEVYKMVPTNCERLVEVTYIFEASNVIHVPGRIDFQEKWLQDIIDAKIRFFKTITFSVSTELC